MTKPILVLDTNVVLDLLHFDDPVARPLLHALETGRVACVVTDATVEELRRVLAYPEFALEPARQAALLEGYQVLSMTVETVAVAAALPHKGTPIHYGLKHVWSRMPHKGTPIHYGLKHVWSRMPHKGTPIHYGLKPVWSRMPRCSDPDDQKFLELAAAAQAQGLISKDRALLKLRRCCAPRFRIMSPVEAVCWLNDIDT